MRSLVAVVIVASLAGGCTRTAGIASTTVGLLAVGGGIALVATNESCGDDSCRWGTSQGWGGGLLIVAGAALVIAGLVGYSTAKDEPERPVTTAAPAPMIVDPNQRDTEQDRLAVQASLAARRGDCTGTVVAMKRLADLDAALWERLRLHDPPIAGCMP